MKHTIKLAILFSLIIIWLVFMQEFIAALFLFLAWIIGIILAEFITGRREKHDSN